MIELELCSNIYGQLSNEYKQRILGYMKSPTADNWDLIQSIIINGRCFTTIWQAVRMVDSTFPTRGRKYDNEWNIIEEWARIPTPELLKKALVFATH